MPLNAPLEYTVEMFGKLGVRHVVVVDGDTAEVVGVVVKKRLQGFFDALR